MLPPECPYTAAQLQQLELQLMAYRYAYYVLCEPLIPDCDYDQMELVARRWLPEHSPLQQVGSDLASSYTAQQIDYAGKLKRGEVSVLYL